MTEPAAPAQTVEVELTSMAHGGEAVGRTAEGMVVFASGGLPGERALVALDEHQGRFARGALVRAPHPAAPNRVVAACPHFGAWPARGTSPGAWCGACQWQHIAYASQLEYKATVLKDALVRIGRMADPPVLETWGMDQPWAYRNHIRLVADGAGLGFRSADGETVVPIDVCPIAHPLVEGLLGLAWEGLDPGIEVSLRCGTRTGERMIVIHGGPDDLEAVEIDADVSVALIDEDGTMHSAAGNPFLHEELGGRLFRIPADAFFQVNTEMAERLVGAVRSALAADASGPLTRLVDVHSGVGTFAILAADLATEVFAIERHAASVAAAVDNAEGLDNLTLLETSAGEGLEYLKTEYPGHGIDAVVLDPPRAGIDRSTGRLLAEIAPRTIVYVSCEPSTLARDLGQLVSEGYVLESCRPVDLFPQTFHVESVSVLRHP